MAKKQAVDTLTKYAEIKKDLNQGIIKPYYLLMGEEPYYLDLICKEIQEKALQEEERDFNQYILYATDTTTSEIVSTASRFPMMSQRQLVIIKEAQALKNLDSLVKYIEHPFESTILVLFFTGKNADKRTSFYKASQKHGEILESQKLSEAAIPAWINNKIKSLGKNIETQASLLLAESTGTELRKIDLEIDKLIKAIDINSKTITVQDIEDNIGISREFNATELTSALASKNSEKAYKIAYFFGESPKRYPIQMTLGFLFYFFSKVEQVYAIVNKSNVTIQEAVRKAGIYYPNDYLQATKNYKAVQIMKIISLLKECDYKSKSNIGGNASDGELLLELIGKILA